MRMRASTTRGCVVATAHGGTRKGRRHPDAHAVRAARSATEACGARRSSMRRRSATRGPRACDRQCRRSVGGARARHDRRRRRRRHACVTSRAATSSCRAIHAEEHAYILQNADNRIVFAIPYQGRYTLIGTTDVPVDGQYDAAATISDDRGAAHYLARRLVNRYLERPIARADIVWTYSGVRPLYDDGESDPAAVTRDYVLKVDAGVDDGHAPVLSVVRRQAHDLPQAGRGRAARAAPVLPRDVGRRGRRATCCRAAIFPDVIARRTWTSWSARHPSLPAPDCVADLVKRHGTRASTVLGDAKSAADLGSRVRRATSPSARSTTCDANEWARSADDVLWRRTKCGLGATRRAARRAGCASRRVTADADQATLVGLRAPACSAARTSERARAMSLRRARSANCSRKIALRSFTAAAASA